MISIYAKNNLLYDFQVLHAGKITGLFLLKFSILSEVLQSHQHYEKL